VAPVALEKDVSKLSDLDVVPSPDLVTHSVSESNP